MKKILTSTLLSLSIICLTSARAKVSRVNCPPGSVALCDWQWNQVYEGYLYNLGYNSPWSVGVPEHLRLEARKLADQAFEDCLRQKGCPTAIPR